MTRGVYYFPVVTYRRRLLLALLTLLAPAGLAAQAAPRDTLHLLFVGDLNFGRSLARNYIFAGRGDEVLAGVRERLRAADVAVGNLESIILDRGERTDTTNSPVFAGPLESIALLEDAGFDVLGNANNHAWDFGHAGLMENLAHLDAAGLAHAGTGPTPGDAWHPAVVHVKGWTVAIFSLTAIFNYPDLVVAGHPAECCVAWADTLEAAARFREAREVLGADLVIAFVHAGMEYRPAPEPDVVLRFRGLIHAGADAVIGHHPHVPQGVEYVDGRPVVYSLGNFVFKQPRPWTDRALMAELTVTDPEAPAAAPTAADRIADQATGRALGGPAPAHVEGVRPAVRLTLIPLAVGYAPSLLTGADSAAVMAHADSISRMIPAHPRLPNPRARRNVAHPRPTTRNP